jgi:hypothetical protein
MPATLALTLTGAITITSDITDATNIRGLTTAFDSNDNVSERREVDSVAPLNEQYNVHDKRATQISERRTFSASRLL